MSTNDSIDKVQESWEGLGRSEPFWSVLTGEEFKSDKITHQAQQVFFESGAAEIDLVRGLLRRADLVLPAGKCLDYGCGVGRVTIHLAGLFDSVLGADISRPHLAIAADYASKHAVNNVVYHHRQRDVFAAMATEDCLPMGVFEIDRVGGGWSSHYFLFRRPN